MEPPKSILGKISAKRGMNKMIPGKTFEKASKMIGTIPIPNIIWKELIKKCLSRIIFALLKLLPSQ